MFLLLILADGQFRCAHNENIIGNYMYLQVPAQLSMYLQRMSLVHCPATIPALATRVDNWHADKFPRAQHSKRGTVVKPVVETLKKHLTKTTSTYTKLNKAKIPYVIVQHYKPT